jgi:hypothetical protein
VPRALLCRAPDDPRQQLVKRVVGLPGDWLLSARTQPSGSGHENGQPPQSTRSTNPSAGACEQHTLAKSAPDQGMHRTAGSAQYHLSPMLVPQVGHASQLLVCMLAVAPYGRAQARGSCRLLVSMVHAVCVWFKCVVPTSRDQASSKHCAALLSHVVSTYPTSMANPLS